MEHKSKASVLIPVYNAGAFVREAVESITNQTYSNLEIIIVDDGSTDGCIALLDGIHDDRITIIKKENGGKSTALNIAMHIMTGDFWAIQDADDASAPNRIERQVEMLQRCPELAAVFVGTELIYRGKPFAPIYPDETCESCRAKILEYKLPAHDATGLYRTSMTKEMLFDEALRIGQGVDYVFRVGERYDIAVLDECLYRHRVNALSVTHENPERNYTFVNEVLLKACKRRGLAFDKIKMSNQPSNLKNERGRDSVIPYAIESVISCKRKGKSWLAIKTSIASILVNPKDLYYYKPIVFCFLPGAFVIWFRKLKRWVRSRKL